MVSVSGVTKYINGKKILDDINFSILPGEVVGLLGPNGAGKSTTIKVILGLLSLDKGSVNISTNQIGYLPETPPLYFDMTAKAYLKYAAELKDIAIDKIGFEIDKVCQYFDLTEVKNRLIKNLSKGYAQRIGIAQAFLGSPQFIILDEPTVALDPRQIVQFKNIIQMEKLTKSILFSTHILGDAEDVCDRMVIMDKGRVIAQDDLAGLRKIYQQKIAQTKKVFNQDNPNMEKIFLELTQ